MPFLDKHGIGVGGDINNTPLMSRHQVGGKIIGLDDKYYGVFTNSYPAQIKIRDRRTHRLIRTTNTSYNLMPGILSGDKFIGVYRDSNNSYFFGEINTKTGAVITQIGSASWREEQPPGMFYNGNNYVLYNANTLLKYNNSGTRVATITVSNVHNILGIIDDKIYLGVSDGGFQIYSLTTNTILATNPAPTGVAGFQPSNAIFLKNGNLVLSYKYGNQGNHSVVLLTTTNGLNYTLKTRLVNHSMAILVNKAKEQIFTFGKIVNAELNTVIAEAPGEHVDSPYFPTDNKDALIFANGNNNSNGFIITKGVIA